MSKYVYRTASVCAGNEGRIGLSSVAGIVTGPMLRRVVADSSAWGSGAKLAGLIDIRAAVLGVRPDDLLRAAVESGRSGLDVQPTAFVCAPDQIRLLRDYAELAGALGALKGVFSCPAAARAWTDRQAQVRAHRLERRARLAGP